MAGGMALPLLEFFTSLEESNLPKVLQVCSGVYFQGSVYEISGSEVCFSTGDLIKVIQIELHSVSCEDVLSNERFELPISHTGLFKVIPEEMAYSSIEEMLSLRPVDLESCLPFNFTSRFKMTIGDFTLGPGRALTLVSIERHEGKEDRVRCRVKGQQEASAEVCIPVSLSGEFNECESEECFSLREIMSSPCLRTRRFRFSNAAKSQHQLILSPVYQIHALMNMRKDIVRFPSSLEVDVIDVTDLCHDLEFVIPLSPTDVMSQPDTSFPVVVDVTEAPGNRTMLKSKWLTELIKGSRLVFHKKETKPLLLLSSPRGKKTPQYFLVSQEYGGRLRKRPREFNSVYELYAALTQTPGLVVNVTKNCDEDEAEGLPGLGIGEQLEVVCCTRIELPKENSRGEKQSVEALSCWRLQECDDGEDEDDEVEGENKKVEVLLPLYMQGHFVEVLPGNRKYKLSDLGKDNGLPLDVKVVSRDAELEADPLVGFASLRIEGVLVEPVIKASFLHQPNSCFEIPARWISMSVALSKDSVPSSEGQPSKRHTEKVTEVTDDFFYEFRQHGHLNEAPPPRPPKRTPSGEKKTKRATKRGNKNKHQKQRGLLTDQMSDLSLNKKRPPAPLPPEDVDDKPPPLVPRKHSEAGLMAGKALPNTYVKVSQSQKKVPLCDEEDDDSAHDYETIEDSSMTDKVKVAHDSIIYY